MEGVMAQVIAGPSSVCPWCGWRGCDCIYARLLKAENARLIPKGTIVYCHENGVEEFVEYVTIQ